MGVEVAVLAGAILAGAGVTAWSSHQSQVNQQKRQAGLLKDAERKEQQIKDATAKAESESERVARQRVISKQRARTKTILTGAEGTEGENLKKEKLGA